MKNQPTPEELQIAIRLHCLECSGGSRKLVHACNIKTCRLYPYRETETARKPKKEKGQMNIFELIREAT